MKTFFAGAVAIALISFAAPSVAEETQAAPLAVTTPAATTAPAEAPPAKPVEPKKICRSEEQLGTIFKKRTCHTQEEWDAIDAATRRDAEDKMSTIGGGLTAPGN